MRKMRRLQDLSLFAKMLIIILLVCLTLTIGNSLIQGITYRAYDEQLYFYASHIATSFEGQIESKLLQLNTTSLSIIGNKDIQKKLGVLHDTEVNSYRWSQALKDLQSYVMTYAYNLDIFCDYCIYSDIGFTAGNMEILSEQDKRILHDVAASYEGRPYIIVYNNNVYFLRQIREIPGMTMNNLGAIIGRIDIQKLMKECARTYAESGFDLQASVIADGIPIYTERENVTPLAQDGWEIQGSRFVSQRTDSRGWKYLVAISYADIHETISIAIFRSSVLAICIAVIALTVGYWLIKRATRHLEMLMKKIDAYRDGILPSPAEMELHANRQDEFGRLHRHFDRMAYDLKRLNDKNFDSMLQQKEAQYKQLQQQIQPHFIFNTLSLITWIAYEHKDTEIAEITGSLSRLLRTSMSFTEKTVCVRDELKLVSDYMLIQKKRFGDRLQYEMSIPEELQDVQIPQLTIQPLVENSIKYALESMLDVCTIHLTGRIEGDTAVIIVEDNGPGMDTEILEKLETRKITVNGHGIGLQNIHKRLQLLFSDQYGLAFHKAGDKTQVWIRVPATTSEINTAEDTVAAGRQ